MKLTREEALKLHLQMWTDMQRELGDNPTIFERELYKRQWCEEHFPNEHISDNCFLCEYVETMTSGQGCFSVNCDYCPIKWDFDVCFDGGSVKKSYRNMPISELLKLPERKPIAADKITTELL